MTLEVPLDCGLMGPGAQRAGPPQLQTRNPKHPPEHHSIFCNARETCIRVCITAQVGTSSSTQTRSPRPAEAFCCQAVLGSCCWGFHVRLKSRKKASRCSSATGEPCHCLGRRSYNHYVNTIIFRPLYSE